MNDPLHWYGVKNVPGTADDVFVAEGRHNVEGALRHGFALVSVLFVGDAQADLAGRLPGDTPVFRKTKAEARDVFGVDFHLGVAALVRAPAPQRLEEVLPAGFAADAPSKTIVVCPCLGDASNLGAIVRNAAAFGAEAVVCGDRGVSPWSRKAVRAASGTMFAIPVFVSPDLHADLDAAVAHGATLAATRLAPDAVALPDWRPAGRHTLILMGGEAHGLAPEWLRHPHDAVIIPMAPGIDSLNVAATSAIVLYHLKHRRPN